MGGLHKGHLSLIKEAKKYKCKICVSIFVNPTQFNKKNDFKNYPRNLKSDIKKLKKLKINYLYLPSYADIYSLKTKNKIRKVLKNIFNQKPSNDLSEIIEKALN